MELSSIVNPSQALIEDQSNPNISLVIPAIAGWKSLDSWFQEYLEIKPTGMKLIFFFTHLYP